MRRNQTHPRGMKDKQRAYISSQKTQQRFCEHGSRATQLPRGLRNVKKEHWSGEVDGIFSNLQTPLPAILRNARQNAGTRWMGSDKDAYIARGGSGGKGAKRISVIAGTCFLR